MSAGIRFSTEAPLQCKKNRQGISHDLLTPRTYVGAHFSRESPAAII